LLDRIAKCNTGIATRKKVLTPVLVKRESTDRKV